MLNTALVIGREEVRFSTIDMSVFDLYNGKCEILKAGASVTFIKSDDGVECVKSTSLPIGVVSNLEIEQRKMKLQNSKKKLNLIFHFQIFILIKSFWKVFQAF